MRSTHCRLRCRTSCAYVNRLAASVRVLDCGAQAYHGGSILFLAGLVIDGLVARAIVSIYGVQVLLKVEALSGARASHGCTSHVAVARGTPARNRQSNRCRRRPCSLRATRTSASARRPERRLLLADA